MSTKHVNVSEGVRLSGLRSVSRRVHSVSGIVQTLLPKAWWNLCTSTDLKSSVTVPFTCWLLCQGNEYLVSYILCYYNNFLDDTSYE